MKQLKDYIDDNGMICKIIQRQGPWLEGGDSIHNNMTVHAVMKMTSNSGHPDMRWFMADVKALEIRTQPGVSCRNPDKSMWYSRSTVLSRDAFKPKIIAEAVHAQTDSHARVALKNTYKAHRKNSFLWAWNTTHNWQFKSEDRHLNAIKRGKIGAGVKWSPKPKRADFTGFEIAGIFARGMNRRRDLQYLGDLETLLRLVFKLLFKRNKNIRGHFDDRNIALPIAYGNWLKPTFVIRLCRRLYTKRAKVAFKIWWGSDVNEPPIDEIMELLVKEGLL